MSKTHKNKCNHKWEESQQVWVPGTIYVTAFRDCTKCLVRQEVTTAPISANPPWRVPPPLKKWRVLDEFERFPDEKTLQILKAIRPVPTTDEVSPQ